MRREPKPVEMGVHQREWKLGVVHTESMCFLLFPLPYWLGCRKAGTTQ